MVSGVVEPVLLVVLPVAPGFVVPVVPVLVLPVPLGLVVLLG